MQKVKVKICKSEKQQKMRAKIGWSAMGSKKIGKSEHFLRA
jgi:hypothetical protein